MINPKYSGKKTCAYDNFPKSQAKKLANKHMTNSRTLFLKLIGVYIYIYSIISYLAVDNVFP